MNENTKQIFVRQVEPIYEKGVDQTTMDEARMLLVGILLSIWNGRHLFFSAFCFPLFCV